MADLVLLTGISGFLAGHVALALLNAGYRVRGSVRDLGLADSVKANLARAGGDVSRLEIVGLDLLSDAGWAEAMEGARYLEHVASPFVTNMPRDKSKLIRPAVEGTRRAIEAALGSGVERVVLTSSMAAAVYGHDEPRSAPFGPADWTNLHGRPVNAYAESKTRAEQTAWTLMDSAGRHDDLVAINPYYILGPLLMDDARTSVSLVLRLMDGSVPMAARFYFSIVDVRDVARLHVRTLTAPDAGGHRFTFGGPSLSFLDMAGIIRDAMPEFAPRLPRRDAPDWIVRLFSLVVPEVRGHGGEVGMVRVIDSSDAARLLGVPVTSPREAILATARDLVARGLVTAPGAKKG